MDNTPLQDTSFKPPRSSTTRHRMSRCVFTLNNYSDQEYEELKNLPVKWLIIGKELGENGTPHLQGAFVIGSQVAFSTIKTWPGLRRSHIESMRGSCQDSLKYCSKQDVNPFIKGEMPQPGKRNDLHDVIDLIKTGESMRTIAQTEKGATAIVRYHKGLTTLKTLLTPSRSQPPTVLWFHGPTGSGKTKCAYELGELLYGPDSTWISHANLKWFCGYDNQPVAILDDFRTSHCTFSFLLRVLDRYPMGVEPKGSTVSWLPKLIIITAPYSPTDMFNLKQEGDVNQLLRRIHRIISFPTTLSLRDTLLGTQLESAEAWNTIPAVGTLPEVHQVDPSSELCLPSDKEEEVIFIKEFKSEQIDLTQDSDGGEEEEKEDSELSVDEEEYKNKYCYDY